MRRGQFTRDRVARIAARVRHWEWLAARDMQVSFARELTPDERIAYQRRMAQVGATRAIAGRRASDDNTGWQTRCPRLPHVGN